MGETQTIHTNLEGFQQFLMDYRRSRHPGTPPTRPFTLILETGWCRMDYHIPGGATIRFEEVEPPGMDSITVNVTIEGKDTDKTAAYWRELSRALAEQFLEHLVPPEPHGGTASKWIDWMHDAARAGQNFTLAEIARKSGGHRYRTMVNAHSGCSDPDCPIRRRKKM